MPELPEVETIRRQLEARLVGRHIVAAEAHPSDRFAAARLASGSRVEQVDRRGKYLLFGLRADRAEPRELVLHLGMTGSLLITGADGDSYVRARWDLDDGTTLAYRDVRRFGRIAVVRAGDHRSIPTLARQGPDALDEDFGPEALWRGLRASRRHLKTQLLSQRPVAGIGNIYADEALWAAQLHPARRRISKAEATRLHAAVLAVLAQGLANRGTTLRDYRTFDGRPGENQCALACYGRRGQPCTRCQSPLAHTVLDARGTTWCPTCQTARPVRAPTARPLP